MIAENDHTIDWIHCNHLTILHCNRAHHLGLHVSNKLGAGRPHAACLAVRGTVFMAESLVIGLVLVCVHYIWGHAYSNEDEVVRDVAKMMLVISFSNFFDVIQCVLSGVARGCGWQKIIACVNLGAYYIVGIPSAYLIAFILHVGGMGLWLGIICGILVQVVLLMAITLCTNWDRGSKCEGCDSYISELGD